MFQACHSAHEVRHLYRVRYGVPAEQLGHQVCFTTTDRLGVVTMPAQLGSAVQRFFVPTSPPPVIVHARSRTRVFPVSVGPGRPLGYRGVAALERHKIIVTEIGTRVWLPMSDAQLGWYWSPAPVPSPLPFISRAELLSAALSVAFEQQAAYPSRR